MHSFSWATRRFSQQRCCTFCERNFDLKRDDFHTWVWRKNMCFFHCRKMDAAVEQSTPKQLSEQNTFGLWKRISLLRLPLITLINGSKPCFTKFDKTTGFVPSTCGSQRWKFSKFIAKKRTTILIKVGIILTSRNDLQPYGIWAELALEKIAVKTTQHLNCYCEWWKKHLTFWRQWCFLID